MPNSTGLEYVQKDYIHLLKKVRGMRGSPGLPAGGRLDRSRYLPCKIIDKIRDNV